jgi:murein lipoprotein
MLQRNSHLAALMALLVASVSGCATATQPESKAAAPVAAAPAAAPAVPALSEAAVNALKQAEADVKMAKSKFALWTTAEKALKDAQEAAKAGDSAKVIKAAATVASQVKGGLEQLNYPSTEI